MTTDFLPVNLQGVAERDPKKAEEILRLAAKERGKWYEDQWRRVLKTGAFMFSRRTSAQRLAWYIEKTLVADIPLILDENYLAKRELGAALPLQAETMIKSRQAAQVQQAQLIMQAQMMGLQPPELPPLPPDAPNLWPGLLPPAFPPLVWDYFAKDLRDLLKPEAEVQ